MKKRSAILLALCSFFLLSFSAFAVDAPTVYGLVKKEMKYIKQDSEANARTMFGPKDVDGYETRFGIKGAVPTGEAKAGYVVEAGFNSVLENSATERIRIRLAYLNWGSEAYGTMTAGQSYLPGMVRNIFFDPLVGTAVELLGLDWAPLVGSFGGTGGGATQLHPYLPRAPWSDMLGYESPSFYGFKVALAYDKNQQEYYQKNSLAGASNGQYWMTYALYFDKAVNSDVKLQGTAVYSNQYIEGVIKEDMDSYWNFSGKVFVSKFSLGAGYYLYEVDRNVKNYTWLITGSFDILPELTWAATYMKDRLSEHNTAIAINGTQGYQSQIATGLIYKINPYVNTHFVAGFYNRDWNGGLSPAGTFEKSTGKNSTNATQIALGMTVNF
ncbi:MAG: porin [Oligoflexia bacterium]|nr:porin [Oligoflexia bacterium]